MTREKKIAIVVIGLIAFGLAACESFGQFMRYPVRPIAATSQCADGKCPPSATTATTAKAKEEAKKDEVKLIDTTAAEPGVDSSQDSVLPSVPTPENPEEDKEWTTPNITDDASNNDLGAITLVYPTTAQTKDDEVVAYAAASGRRAKEPVAEDDELDSETPIGSIRNVGARLKELTSAIKEQQEKIDTLIDEDGEYASIVDSIKKLRESDEAFQKDAREGLASVLEAVKKQNEGFIAERVKEAVTPAPSTVWKWTVVALVGLTILIIWFILIVKLIGWFISLGKNSIARVVESAVSSVRAVKNDSNSADEIKL